MDQDQSQFTIRTYMAIMAERDAAIEERNVCLEERKRALAERDMAMLQRDAATAEREFAIRERDEAIAALKSLTDTTSDAEENLVSDDRNTSVKPKKARQLKDRNRTRCVDVPGVAETSPEELKGLLGSHCPGDEEDEAGDRVQDQTSRWIVFDESVMPTPVCTCTGSPQPCYRWGNGGWQSACCTTAISMYPLPQVSNKRYTRVAGRKMSGNAFAKLLNRLASEGYNLSAPLDLKDHWAKHGTNRYTTVK